MATGGRCTGNVRRTASPAPFPRLQPSEATLMIWLFAATALSSAFLLFWVEPLFAKLVLPLLGGSPAVWNTCLMYFQALLLIGYLYAHASSRYLAPRRQVLVHGLLLLLCIVQLPLGLRAGWIPPQSGTVIPWLVGALTVSMAAPFLLLSATAPLLQRWLAAMTPPVENPYVLYAASNAGSFVGLLAFPLLLEPALRLRDQTRLWSLGFIAAVLLIAACGAAIWRRLPAKGVAALESEGEPPSWRRRLHWVVLAFVPSSLLLGVTTYLSTDVAATPLLWVVPLSLYLLTFVLVFAKGGRYLGKPAALVHSILVTTLAVVFFWQAGIGFQRSYALHLLLFFFTTLVLHGELARLRPHPAYLTGYYLWLAFGGALGGAFTALLVPVVFESTRDYLMMLAIACFIRPSRRLAVDALIFRARNFAFVLLPAVLLAFAWRNDAEDFEILGVEAFLVVSVAAGLLALSVRRNALRFGLAISAIGVAGLILHDKTPTMYADRSFFGIYKVGDASGPARLLYHGTTIHGAQFTDARRLKPITYYHPDGPVGQVLRHVQSRGGPRRIGVVGLGTGSILCYSQPGEEWIFFEIDPAVERIARNPRLFTFLRDCAVKPRVVIGDARLTLAREQPGTYSLLVLDAFSSDAIPVHLMTREALALYLQLLKDDGILLVHISNRRLELEKVVGDIAVDARVPALIQDHDTNRERQYREYDYDSDWVVIARSAEHLSTFAADTLWNRVRNNEDIRPWTDDYSNIISVIRR